MKSFAILSSLLLSGLVSAQDQQSDPFHLVIKSSNPDLDGQQVSSCHVGAAIQNVCLLGRDNGATFYFNTTEGSTSPIDGYEPASVLGWDLPAGNETYPLGMRFYVDPSTNVAQLMFQPSYEVSYITVDQDDNLAVFSNLDDTVTPPKTVDTYGLHKWYVCETTYSGYQYKTLNWVVGNANVEPQNPSCTKIGVHREYI